MKVKIYVIIVTYNGAKWINKCFGSLINSTVALKVVAFDNGSTDSTPNIIRNSFPEVEVIETGSNLGFGKANNLGLKKALDEGADYVFLLNQDAWVTTQTIEKLICAHKEKKEFSLLSPIPLIPNGKLDLNFSDYYASKEFLEHYNHKKFKTNIYEIPFINAAGWLLPKSTLRHTGFFDPLFGHYGEDVDYCKRILSIGGKIGIVSSSHYFHDRPQIPIQETTLDNQIYHFIIQQTLFSRWSELSSFQTEKIRVTLFFLKVCFCLKNNRWDLAKGIIESFVSQLRSRTQIQDRRPHFN